MPAGQRGPLSTRGTSEAGGGVLVKSFAWCVRCHGRNPSVTCGASSPFRGAYIPKGEPECKKPPLKGEGDQRSWWRGSCEIFCLMCEVSRKKPLSQAYGLPAQHKARPAGALKGSLETQGEPRLKASPLGEGNQRSWWRGSVWNLLFGVKGLRDNPSVTCGASSPKGEPNRRSLF